MVAWLAETPGKDYKRELIEACREFDPALHRECLSAVIRRWDSDVGDLAVEELRRTDAELLETLLLDILGRAERHFEAFVPLARQVLAGRMACPEALAAEDIYRSLATGANRLRSGVVRTREDAEQVYKVARAALTDPKIVKGVIAATPVPEVARLYALVSSLRRLDPRPLRILESAIHETHPEVLQPVADTRKPDENVIFTTPAGLEKLRRQYDQLVHEELPKVADALGHAISLGDISDNAEYRSARQRQQDLVERARRMREDLGRAREKTPEDVTGDEVGFGVQVDVTNLDTGEARSYQILGPWDVDAEQGIISYLSPLGRAFWGTRAGQEVTATLPGSSARYRIEAIRPAPEP
jgi:transcription elongation GreA/GreB family factor